MLNVCKYEYDWCCEGDYKMTKYEKQYPRSTLWEPEQMPYSCIMADCTVMRLLRRYI